MARPFWTVAHFKDIFGDFKLNALALNTSDRGTIHTCYDASAAVFALKIVPHTPTALNALLLQQSIPPHPNICPLLRVYFNPRTPRIAALAPHITTKYVIVILTPLARHGDLFNHLERGICVTYVFDRIMSALAHMHRHGIVHGDIKPENFLCFTDGEFPHIELIDFEFCHRATDPDWTPAGTPNFAPPEIYFPHIRSNGCVTTAADIWSAGITLYILLFNRIPINNKRGNFRLSHFHVRIPDRAPQCLRSVLYSMLQPNPQHRPTADRTRQLLREY